MNKETIVINKNKKDMTRGEKEVVFRPIAGYSIGIAVLQALKKQRESKGSIVLAFNGAYIPVEGKTADEIVSEYHKWLEKQGTQKPSGKVEPEFIAEALNVPEEDVEQALAIMRDNMQSNLEANETMRENDES